MGRRKDIGCGEAQQAASDVVAVHYFPVDGVGLAQQLVGLFHIAFSSSLTDIGAADVTPVVLFLFYDMEMITQVTGHGREQLCAASALVAKAAVRAYHDFPWHACGLPECPLQRLPAPYGVFPR